MRFPGTSLVMSRPPSQDHRRAVGPHVLKGPRVVCLLTSEVPLYRGTSTLNPQPSALNSQPSILNTQHSTLNTQHYTLNPQPSKLNPQPYRRDTFPPVDSSTRPMAPMPSHWLQCVSTPQNPRPSTRLALYKNFKKIGGGDMHDPSDTSA